MIEQTTDLASHDIGSPENIVASLAAVYADSRWSLPCADSRFHSTSALIFSVGKGCIVTNLGQHPEHDLRSMTASLLRSLQEDGFCRKDGQLNCHVDPSTGSLSIVANAFRWEMLKAVSEAVALKDCINQFCEGCGFRTTWRISRDVQETLHLETPVARLLTWPGARVGQAAAKPAEEAQDFFPEAQGDLLQACDKDLIRNVASAFKAVGIIERATDMKLLQGQFTGMACDTDEFEVLLRLPADKIRNLSGAIGYLERSTLSKPVFNTTVRAAPFIEDFVRNQIEGGTVGELTTERLVAPTCAQMLDQSLRAASFKVVVRPMTVALPSVNVAVHFKEQYALDICEQRFRAHGLEVRTEGSHERGFVGAVRILDCSDSRFKDFLESTIAKSLNDSWAVL